jgi:3-deoxy-manno-octulosonate cytidylyltransferase (CMP-KDO synthetase)
MSFIVVIPARFASTRLPGKPLLDIAGKPMLQHVYERALQSRAGAAYIATDDERIAKAALAFNAKVCMTSPSHPSGTDRIHEVAEQLELADDAVVVNVQGDEPLIPPSAINQVADDLLTHPEAGISSLCEVIHTLEEINNPNTVKVVFDHRGYALYFSRAAIPYSSGTCFRHIGIYAYRRRTLNQFVDWSPAALEMQEKLEQLRALFNGVRIHMEVASERIPGGVDTPQDLEAVRALLREQQ